MQGWLPHDQTAMKTLHEVFLNSNTWNSEIMFSNRKIFFFTLEDTLALAPYIIAKNSQLQLQELGRTSTGFNEEPNDAPGSHCTRL